MHSARAASTFRTGWRRVLDATLVVYVLLVVHIGLIPYEFSVEFVGRGILTAIPASRHLPDTIANVALYAPLGCLLVAACRRRGQSVVRTVAVTLLSAIGLSLAVEVVQASAASRVSSLIDVASNLGGTLVGGALAMLSGSLARGIRNASLREFRDRPIFAASQALALLMVACALMPFALSFDRSRLAAAWETAHWVPFESFVRAASASAAAERAGDEVQYLMARWSAANLVARWSAEMASFALFSTLVLMSLRVEFQFRRAGAMLLTSWLGSLLAVGMSVLQWPVIGRGLDVTDILFRCFGVALPTVAWLLWCGSADERDVLHGLDRRRWALSGYALVASFIVFHGLAPFVLRWNILEIIAKITSPAVLPFFGMFQTRVDRAAGDGIFKVTCFAILASFAATSTGRHDRASRRQRIRAIVWKNVGLAAIVEVLQCAIPLRVVSLTDPLLAAAGALIGVFTFDGFMGLLLAARNASIPRRKSRRRTRLSPADQLVASLADAAPGAPAELPTSRRRPQSAESGS